MDACVYKLDRKMSGQAPMSECSTDVLVVLAESLRIFTGLLTVATVFGGLSGILAAGLLYVFCLKPMLLTRQGYNARRMFEPDNVEVDSPQIDSASDGKKEVPSGTNKDKKQPPVNDDVAAFASRAKVVYPINQKYRPLADGASNPSLHEPSKLPATPNEESSSSSTEESQSQDQDNDDSSHFISSSMVPKSLQNQSFIRVSQYPHTLTLTGFKARISLYCLALQDIQHHCSELQEEKCLIYLLMVKKTFSLRFPKDKNDNDFSKNVLIVQEKGLDDLKKQRSTDKQSAERNQELSADGPCTLEEMDRAQKGVLEDGLQMTKGFSRQVEHLCQHLLSRTSVLPIAEAHDIIHSLIQTLLLVENHLNIAQGAYLKRIQERLLWWEEFICLFQSKLALVRQEASLRQSLIARALGQLTSDGLLNISLMEKTLSELQGDLIDGLQQCTEECIMKTKELVRENVRRTESKKKKAQRSQAKEKTKVLDSAQSHSDTQQFTKIYLELLMKHRQQNTELDVQQDERAAEVLCALWSRHCCSWSKRLGELAKELFLTALASQSELSTEQREKLWLDLEQDVVAQLQEAESSTKLQLENMRTQLDHEEQVWYEETALVQACLRHLTEQQMKILRAVVVKQNYTLNGRVGMLIEKRQEHLLAAVKRHFVARHFCLHVLKEMRLSKLKVLAKNGFRALLQEDHNKSQPADDSPSKDHNRGSSASLAERHLVPESQLLRQGFQQEFLSELETGAELLQDHAQLLIGNALGHAIWGLMEAPPNEEQKSLRDDSRKCHLTEAASESVYVTKDSLNALVQSYYTQIQDITSKLQQDQTIIDREEDEKCRSSSQFNKALLRELVNWGKKPASTEFQQRVELYKRRVLEQYELQQEDLCETLCRQKIAQGQAMDRVNRQLLEAEETFIAELSALARVSLHSVEAEPSSEEDNAGVPNSNILNLLAMNPALDPALNPSLTLS